MIQNILDQILSTKNWSSILLRTKLRDELKSYLDVNSSQWESSESVHRSSLCSTMNERVLFEYLHALSQDQLVEFRHRVFKLAKDNYYEHLLQKLFISNVTPSLKPLLSASEDTENISNESSYILKCNVIRDIVECIGCTIKTLDQNMLNEVENLAECLLPTRCVDQRSSRNKINFPLGKDALLYNMNSMKQLQQKLLKHQNELEKMKQLISDLDKSEKDYKVLNFKWSMCREENQFLRFCLLILLIILFSMIASYIFMNSFRVAPLKT